MSDVTPETGDPTPATPTEPAASETETVDWKAEAEKYKAMSRKNEDRAKANAAAAKELEQLKRDQMSDVDRAVDLARNETRATVLAELASERVKDVFESLLADHEDADDLIDGLNFGRFVVDGQPDKKAIKAWVDRVAPKADPAPSVLDLGQGTRGAPPISPGDDPLLKDLVMKVGPPRR